LWDIQTGGLIDTFHSGSEIKDIAISQKDGHIACHLFDNSVVYWDAHTKNEGTFRDSQPVVTICWFQTAELIIATKSSLLIANTATGTISILNSFHIPDPVWGMVVLSDNVVMVGTSNLGMGGGQGSYSLSPIMCEQGQSSQSLWTFNYIEGQNTRCCGGGELLCPLVVGNEIACVTSLRGVQVFNTTNSCWIKPLLLEKAETLAVSLKRNLVVQTEDSIQIFSTEVLASSTSGKDPQVSCIYPLGENHVVYLQINRDLTIIELETLSKLYPGVNNPLLSSLVKESSTSAQVSCNQGFIAEFGVSKVIQTWQSQVPLPRGMEPAEEDVILGGSSPTWIATLYGLPQKELCAKDVTNGTILAKLPLEGDNSIGAGIAYDLAFDSETRFHLKVDGPGYHVQIPYNIIASPSGQYPYMIKQEKPVPLSEPQTKAPYSLDISCEWVLDVQSRKICWIPPEIMQRSNGGHFWVGTSLVVLGSDGVVRKLSFKEPVSNSATKGRKGRKERIRKEKHNKQRDEPRVYQAQTLMGMGHISKQGTD
jgi:hypothetical protein